MASSAPLAAGCRVRVTGRHGLLLTVARSTTYRGRNPIENDTRENLHDRFHVRLQQHPDRLRRGAHRVVDPHLPRVRARRGVHARPVLEGEGASRADHPDRPAGRADRPAHRRVRRARAGRDHARQRVGEGQCGRVFPRGRSGEGRDPGGALRGDEPARADDAARGARQARTRRAACRARAANADIQKTLDAQTDAWGSRCRRSRSSTST